MLIRLIFDFSQNIKRRFLVQEHDIFMTSFP